MVPEVPVTEAKRRVRLPPGVEVLGVEMSVVAPLVDVTARNWSSGGRRSVRSRSVIVWLLAMSTLTWYSRGKLGPVAVSLSVPMYVFVRMKSVGVVFAEVALPTTDGSAVGLSSGSLPNWNPPTTWTGSGELTSARLLSAAVIVRSAGGWVGVKLP